MLKLIKSQDFNSLSTPHFKSRQKPVFIQKLIFMQIEIFMFFHLLAEMGVLAHNKGSETFFRILITVYFKWVTILINVKQLLSRIYPNLCRTVFHHRCNRYVIAFLLQI